MDPLFRWAGSKKKLLADIKVRLPESFGTYHEPFCGSACLFFDIQPGKAVLSDMNEELILSYRQIQEVPEEVFSYLKTYEVSKDRYYELRAMDLEKMTCSERAARFIYLNKLCFNGVYRTNNAGVFNVPMGTKTGKIPDFDVLKKYSDALCGVKLRSGDFESVLHEVKEGDLVYLDPPYSKPEGRRRGEYGPGSFHFNDIGRLVRILDEIEAVGASFVLSYSDCSIINEQLRPHWNSQVVSVRRHVAGFSAHRRVVDELIVSNFPQCCRG